MQGAVYGREDMRLITFDPLWETMKKKGVTTYTLITKYSFSKGTLDALKHNRSITLATLNDICSILDCAVEEVILYTIHRIKNSEYRFFSDPYSLFAFQGSLAEFAPAGANKFLIIFSGDMCVGENRPSIGREPCVGQPVFLVLFALFVSAGGSPPSPKKNKNPSKIQGCPMRGSSAGAEMLSD